MLLFISSFCIPPTTPEQDADPENKLPKITYSVVLEFMSAFIVDASPVAVLIRSTFRRSKENKDLLPLRSSCSMTRKTHGNG
jgi:hypothetical protein